MIPSALASLAAMDAACPASSGLKLAAWASGMGEDGAVAVDDIAPEDERDFEACFERQVLEVVGGGGVAGFRLSLPGERAGCVEERADLALAQQVGGCFRSGRKLG